MKKIILATIIGTSLFSAEIMASEGGEKKDPIYECTPEETAEYIKAETVSIRSNSPVPLADEVQTAVIAAKLNDESTDNEEHCLAVWADEFNQIDFVGMYQQAKAAYDSFSSASLMAALMNVARDMAVQAVREIVERIIDNVCELLSPEFIEDLIMEKIETDYGFDAEGFLDSPRGTIDGYIGDALEEKYGEAGEYLMNPEELPEDLGDDVDDRIDDKTDEFFG